MEIVKYWKKFDCVKGAPWIHSDDQNHADELLHKGFELNLLPVPYVGDLTKAKLVFGMLNPGLVEGRELEIEKSSNFIEAMRKNIKQDFHSDPYPFMFLDPKWACHPGYTYWMRRFRKFLAEISTMYCIDFETARRRLSQIFATVELVPYHSARYAGDVDKKLPSSTVARRTIQNFKSDTSVIIPRSLRRWNIPEQKGICQYTNQGAWIIRKVRPLLVERLKSYFKDCT